VRGSNGRLHQQRSILARRLVIVTGKGGTGKTTVACALALAAARRGRRTLVLETGRDEQVPALLGRPASPGDPASRRIDPFDALAEYLQERLRLPTLATRALDFQGFRQLMEAAPGWRELITLGKVWHLEQAQSGGRPTWDLLVVDAPATGHGLTFLDVPRVVVQAVRAGPLRRHAGWVEAMVRDPDQTLLLPVALAEELPARETSELVARLRDDVGMSVDRVVVNAVARDPFPPEVPDLDRRLAALPWQTAEAGLPAPTVMVACARHLRRRYEMNRRYLGEIQCETGLPTVTLPLLPAGVRGHKDLETLAAALLAEPESP